MSLLMENSSQILGLKYSFCLSLLAVYSTEIRTKLNVQLCSYTEYWAKAEFIKVVTDAQIFFQRTMNESVKGLLFMVIVLANNLTSEARRRQNDSHDVYKAFEKCKSKMCAARVSFCVIMKDCGCGAVKEGEACDCCDDCFRCLGAKMWRKCCDCVGLCDHVSLNNTGNNHGIPSKSGDLPGQALPTLFEALSYAPHLPVSFMTRQRKGGLGKHGKFVYSDPYNAKLFQSTPAEAADLQNLK